MKMRYSMLIQWSNDDSAYAVSFPEFGEHAPHTHGKTYRQAAKRGKQVLKMLVAHYQEHAMPLPEPHLYASEFAQV